MDLQKLIDRGEIIIQPIIEKCKINTKEITIKKETQIIEKGPCNKISGNKCSAYINPFIKWKLGNCPLASHIIMMEDEQKFKNPLKESKRSRR
jgi:hypothetical protein